MTKNKTVAWYKQTYFWEMIKRTLALFSGGAVFGLHELQVGDGWMLLAGLISLIAGIISIWMVDNDSDGIIDLFQVKKKIIKKEDSNNEEPNEPSN